MILLPMYGPLIPVINHAHVSFGRMELVNEKTKKIYKTKGGRPDLDMQYTVFGQVFEGLDVIEKIANVPKKTPDAKEESREPNSTPKDPVVIERVELSKA